ncbi:hypothetical protein EV356DRAFT_528226 [Viridothelium virens]|uniref:Uncharacterized protein n=1 Tax=Viridothelium virens TaxID=1048519 RepID=A0A6A6HNE5_VIRVR|nr:hypothetical protein EV356DRAFT_528226 [Viridothelium virens]
MQYSSALVSLLSLAISITALPAAEKRQNPTSTTVTLCTGIGFTGFCQTFANEFETCTQIPAPLLKSTGSFNPGPQALCRLTTSADTCTPHGDLFIDNGPIDNLYWYNGTGEFENYGNSATSFLCQQCTNCP